MRTIAASAACMLLLLGGGGAGNQHGTDGHRSTGATTPNRASGSGRLLASGPLLARRFSHSATLLGDGRVLIAGGLQENGVYLDSLEIYDPAARRFIGAGRLPSPRACHSAVRLASGKVLLAGGSDGRRALASALLYDPRTGAVHPTGNLGTARCGAAAVELADGRVLLAGGEGPASEWDVLASAEIYDPATGSFSATGSIGTPRAAHAAARLRDTLSTDSFI